MAFDPATRKVSRTVFSKPGVDIRSAIFNEQREAVAVRYYQSGRLVTEYFDEANRNLDKTLHAAFPGRTVATNSSCVPNGLNPTVRAPPAVTVSIGNCPP